MRSAEQRCPADWNDEATMSSTACSGSAVESTIIALRPPVSAISTAFAGALAANAFVDPLRRLGRAGEADAGDPRVSGEWATHGRAVTRQQLKAAAGTPPRGTSAPPAPR